MADVSVSADYDMPQIGSVPAVWLRIDSPLDALERYVFMLVAIHTARGSRECYPSQQRIADEGKLSRKTVNKALQALIKHGVIRVVRRLKSNTPVYHVAGYDVIQSEGLPWDRASHLTSSVACNPQLQPVPATDPACNQLVTGTEIGSTTYEANCNPGTHKQFLTGEQKEQPLSLRVNTGTVSPAPADAGGHLTPEQSAANSAPEYGTQPKHANRLCSMCDAKVRESATGRYEVAHHVTCPAYRPFVAAVPRADPQEAA